MPQSTGSNSELTGMFTVCQSNEHITDITQVSMVQQLLAGLWCETFRDQLQPSAAEFITTTTAIYSLEYGLHTLMTVPRSTQPSNLREMVK